MNNDDPFRRRRAIEMRTPRDNRFQPHTPLGPGREFDSIRRMIERWGPNARRIGDDAAVITALGDRALVASTDVSVENVHFKREWLTPEEIGYRAAASALSDIAAMGAKPIGMLVAMGIPDGWRASLDLICDGIGIAARECDAPILGGDMSRATELSIGVTVLGTSREPLLRSAARPDDLVYVTGVLGGSRSALRSLQAGRAPVPAHRERFAHPVPRIREAAWLAERGAHSAIDISDGLSGDLAHLAAASRACLVIDVAAIPCIEGSSNIEAASSGEEYEVAVTSPVEIDAGDFETQFGLPLTRIGVVERGAPGVKFLLNGEQIEVQRGYLHFE